MQFSKSRLSASADSFEFAEQTRGLSTSRKRQRAPEANSGLLANGHQADSLTTEQRVRPDPEIRSAGSLSPEGAAFRPAGALRRTE